MWSLRRTTQNGSRATNFRRSRFRLSSWTRRAYSEIKRAFEQRLRTIKKRKMIFTKEQIETLKAKHGDIFLIETQGKSCIIRKPNRRDLSYVSVEKDPIKMQTALLNQLWVEGDEEIKTNDDYFFAVCNTLDEVLKVKEAEIKKL